MKIVTVVSDQNCLGFTLLKLSCSVNDLDLVALICSDKDFKGNRTKDAILKEYLASVDYNEVLLFTDGYDTLMLAPGSEILQKFHLANTEILFSAETCCWPDQRLVVNYPETSSPYKYLNSGGFIGRAGVIKELLSKTLQKCENDFPFSNQYLWTLKFLKFQKLISLDTQCNIFCTFSPEIGESELVETNEDSYNKYVDDKKLWFNDNFLISDNRIINKISQTQPSSVHFNGKSKCLIDHKLVDMLLAKITSARKSTFETRYFSS